MTSPTLTPALETLQDDLIDGLAVEYGLRGDFINQEFQIRVLREDNRIIELQHSSALDIASDQLSDSLRTDLEKERFQNNVIVSDTQGLQTKTLATSQADYDLTRETTTGKASRDAQVFIANRRSAGDIDLAEQRDAFKIGLATTEGSYKTELAYLDADNIVAVSDIRISGEAARSEINIMGIGREAQIDADSIITSSNSTIAINDLATLSDIESLQLNGNVQNVFTELEAQQQVSFISLSNQSEINSDSALSGQRIEAINARSTIEVADIHNNAQQEIAFNILENQQAITNESQQTAIAIENLQTATSIDVDYESQLSTQKIIGIQSEATAKIIQISTITGIETLGDITVSAIENSAFLESANLDVTSDNLINTLEIQDGNQQTSDRITALNAQSQARAGNELTIADAETQIDLAAANQTAAYIQQNSSVRILDVYAEMNNTIANIQQSAAITSLGVLSSAQAAYNSTIINAQVAADFQTQVAEYVNSISRTAAQVKTRYMYIEGLANSNTVSYNYRISNAGATPPEPPNLDPGGYTVFNPPTLTPTNPGFL